MKQIAQNYRSGELTVLEVPVPATRPGGVLVRTQFSLISTGTEMMKVGESKLSLVGKARARPDQVQKVMQSVSQQGLRATYRKVNDRLDAYTPLGYSLCGEVVEVGAGVEELTVGQRVACAGNSYALHAEFNWVPRNLCVPLPDPVTSEHAAFTTVGAIAMQGYRQSEARLGETACVIGLGLVGQLLVQLLRAAGVNVVGLDPSIERCRLAEGSGAAACRPPDPASRGPVLEALAALTDGAGADHIFLTAGGDTNQPVELAAELARDRARVVDIGKCRLDLPWTEYYAKELEIRFSRSLYGPGRYDPSYEEDGVDYPIGHVRWTERRNMACFLDLVAEGRLDLDPLVSAVLPFDEAVDAYERIERGEQGGVGMLFRYSANGSPQRRQAPASQPGRATRRSTAQPVVRLGVIGAGSYATSMLLPHLRDRPDVRLVEVATATGLSAANAQRRFGFERCSTDHRGLLADDDVDAVVIATRHHAHAAMVCEALVAGKAVFVEKPLAVDPDQLQAILAVVAESGNDRLMVGFNRRFAPLLVDLKAAAGTRSGPVQVRYDVNAGRLETGSWYGHPEEGSRLVGEGCHFVDTISWWLDEDPVAVFSAATGDPDDTASTLLYPDGSVATIAYQTGGDPRAPKELFQVVGDRQVARLHNFQRTELWRGGRRKVRRSRAGIDKGQRQELDAFVRAVAEAQAMPIPLASLAATTLATFAARRSLGSRRLEAVAAEQGGAE